MAYQTYLSLGSLMWGCLSHLLLSPMESMGPTGHPGLSFPMACLPFAA